MCTAPPTTFAGMAEDADSEQRVAAAAAAAAADREASLVAAASVGLADRNNSHPRLKICLLYTSPSPRDATLSRMPSSA